MSIWDFAYNNREAATFAYAYGEGLAKFLDKRIGELAAESFAPSGNEPPDIDSLVSLQKSTGKDERGCDFIQYDSRNTRVRIYINFPLGYIVGEISQKVPWTAHRKCFSITRERVQHSGLQLTHIGMMPEMYPGSDNVGAFILEALLTNKIDVEALKQREQLVDLDAH